MDDREIVESLKEIKEFSDLSIDQGFAIDESIKYIGWLSEIEKMVRKAFSDPDTKNITLHRAQVLADILAVFEYDGATLEDDR